MPQGQSAIECYVYFPACLRYRIIRWGYKIVTDSGRQHFTSGFPGFAQRKVAALIEGSGVKINGENPWDIRVHNPALFRRVIIHGSLGLGESYMDRWWECDQVDEFINRLLRTDLADNQKFINHALNWLQSRVFNLQKKPRAFQVGEEHYDAGNDLYRAMLDRRMVYTCGYWANADNLDDAQHDKLNIVCKKMMLSPGMKILDIGCGWGSFAKFAAQEYGVEVVGVTVSREQVELATEQCRGLPVKIHLQDYRDITGRFDGIISLGMFEHVGHKNHREYMRVVKRCLKPDGRFLLHTIGKNNSRTGVDPWISRYIFPNGEIPSLRQINAALEGLMFVEDVHNFGPDYDRTLMAWFENFDAAWASLQGVYSDRFYRMWSYYLKVCAGAFRARNLQLWQIVISNSESFSAYRRPL